MSSNNLFDQKDFTDYVDIDLSVFELHRNDTYDENLISKKILEIGKTVCCGVAIQLAIVGCGQKNFNSITIEGNEIVIQDFFDKNGIKSNEGQGAKLAKDDLTPRRLVRFFRYLTQKYLEDNETVSSYLYTKYCDEDSARNRTLIFPGSEHLLVPDTDDDVAKTLYFTYQRLDDEQESNISDRIRRVLIARKFKRTLFEED